MNKDVTILVNSCDKYEDAWEPFFRLLKIQWPECENCKIVLSTESKIYNCDFLNVKTIISPLSPKNCAWSTRLKHTLEQIDTEYVLFFLEDFFLLEKVQTDIFEKALSILKNNAKICLVEFPSVEQNYKAIESIIYEKVFKKVSLIEPYRAKVMVSLWRKKDFQNLLFENENPWVCEKETSIRTIAYNKKILRQDYLFSKPTFYYHINPKLGFGITQGKWLKNNKAFFESNGIFGINYTNLGVEENAKTYTQLKETSDRKSKEQQKNKFRENSNLDNIKEIFHLVKKKIIKKFKIDLIIKVIKYRKWYKI